MTKQEKITYILAWLRKYGTRNIHCFIYKLYYKKREYMLISYYVESKVFVTEDYVESYNIEEIDVKQLNDIVHQLRIIGSSIDLNRKE